MEKAADQVICLTKGDAKEYKHTKNKYYTQFYQHPP